MSTEIAIQLEHRTALTIDGPDAESFLQGLLTNDVRKADPSRAIFAALLTPQGKFLHDLFLVRTEDGGFLVDCEATRRDDLIRRLTMYRLRSRVEIADAQSDWSIWALLPEEPMPAHEPGRVEKDSDGLRYVDPRNAALGWRAFVRTGQIPAGDRGTLSDYDRRRIALGIPDGSRDIAPEKTLILEAGFDELGGVDFAKGCYIGQELAARMKHRGRIRKRIYPIRTDGRSPAPGTPIEADGKVVGQIHTGIDDRALATLRIEAVESAAPLLAMGQAVEVIGAP